MNVARILFNFGFDGEDIELRHYYYKTENIIVENSRLNLSQSCPNKEFEPEIASLRLGYEGRLPNFPFF